MGAYPRRDTAGINNDLDWVIHRFPKAQGADSYKGGAALSGGEQQMLAVGRALMSKPKLLCLDEPSLGLAPVLMAEVYRGGWLRSTAKDALSFD